MRVEDHRHRRARARRGGETAFETAFGTGEDDFGQSGPAESGARGGAREVARYIGSARLRAIGTRLGPIYLDHAATTPMRPEAVAAVEEGMRRWANPSSPHAEGRAARAALEDARTRIKAALGGAAS